MATAETVLFSVTTVERHAMALYYERASAPVLVINLENTDETAFIPQPYTTWEELHTSVRRAWRHHARELIRECNYDLNGDDADQLPI